jgi:hypothetical protein
VTEGPIVAPTAAIQAWHDGLAGTVGPDSAGELESILRARGLFFGDRALCTVIRPRFLSPSQYALLRREGHLLLRAFDAAWGAAIADPGVFAQFRPESWEAELIGADPGRVVPSPLSRLDAFFQDGGSTFKLTEYNAETPAGSAYGDALTEIFLSLPAAREFLRSHTIWTLPARHNVLHALLDAWQAWSGTRNKPAIAIIDWNDVPTQSEFRLFEKFFRENGYECRILDPAECEYGGARGTGHGARLTAHGSPIDLIYKRILLHELVERGGMDHPIIRAVRDGAVCMANGFRCKLLHKKASLAVLSDERNARLFGPAERAAIARHVPWTRVVEDRRTRVEEGRSGSKGVEVDLLEYAARNRERLVLKPNDDYGGAGIVLGWEVDQSAWEAALRNALAEPCIVQQRIELPSAPYPALTPGGVELADRIEDTAPFVFGGSHIDGCLSRISTASLVNVTAGGGSTVPTFVVEPRPS